MGQAVASGEPLSCLSPTPPRPNLQAEDTQSSYFPLHLILPGPIHLFNKLPLHIC